MSDPSDVILKRLVGQHPAALRSVGWQQTSGTSRLNHLELESKHGQVVVFDHRTPTVYANPPRPGDAEGDRHWRDLTDEAAAIFDNRPTISAIKLSTTDARAPSWRIHLSTARVLIFVLDPATPLLWCE